MIPCFLNDNDFQSIIRVSYWAVKDLSRSSLIWKITDCLILYYAIFMTIHNKFFGQNIRSNILSVRKLIERNSDPFDSKLAFNNGVKISKKFRFVASFFRVQGTSNNSRLFLAAKLKPDTTFLSSHSLRQRKLILTHNHHTRRLYAATDEKGS